MTYEQVSYRTLVGAMAAALSLCVVARIDAQSVVEDNSKSAQIRDIEFSGDILPILSENCFQCHGPDSKTREADLRLDVESSAKGMRDGAVAIVPYKSSDSELVRRITSSDENERMPPSNSNRKLTQAQVELLTRWIEQGAQWKKHWAFETPRRMAVPSSKDADWCHNPIDAFVIKRCEQEGVQHSPEASKEKLLRRLSLDLNGVPPSLQALDDFLADAAPDAYERATDRLLASPRYGERMVWEWLDAARYADTNGYQGDPTRAMWYWRDWAVGAFNAGLAFDQFTLEQLAGDLLPHPSQEQLIATGFHRNHMINGEGGRIAEESRIEYVQDRVETTAAVWLGLTLICARCHDHKYDPISQREYYQLSAYFNSIDESGANDAGGLANPLISLASAEEQKRIELLRSNEQQAEKDRNEIDQKARLEQAAWEMTVDVKPVPEPVRIALATPADQRDPAQKKTVTDHYLSTHAELIAAKKRHDDAKTTREQAERSAPRTMIMRERALPRDTFVLLRGAYNKPGEKVEHGTLTCLPGSSTNASQNRLSLARWLLSPENPLTPRVTVNRFWQQFFASGLVKTAEDFGVQGERPSHPEMLDWLAVEFSSARRGAGGNASEGGLGWDTKALVRTMLTSATYRQQSQVRPGMAERDPGNLLLARGARFRLPSWMLRDQALAVSGLLVERVGGPPVKPYQPEGVWEEATFGQIRYAADRGEALYRRSLYVFWRRIVGPTMFFDVSSRQTCQVKGDRTNTPLHSLVTLNDVTYVEAARALAERMLKSGGGSDRERLIYGFRICTSRLPRQGEQTLLLSALDRFRQQYLTDSEAAQKLISVGESKPDPSLKPIDVAAYTSVTSLLLNLDETLTRE